MLATIKHMLIHPCQGEGLRVFKILYKEHIINSTVSAETQETNILPKVDQGSHQEIQGARRRLNTRGITPPAQYNLNVLIHSHRLYETTTELSGYQIKKGGTKRQKSVQLNASKMKNK